MVESSNLDRIRELGEELSQVENELSRAVERLNIAQKTANVGVYEYDIEAQSVWWSDSMYDIYERTDFDGTIQSWRSYIHPDDQSRVTEQITFAITAQTELINDYRIILPDQSVRWIGNRSGIILDQEGQQLRYVGANIDITQRKEHELADEYLAQTVRNANLPIIVKDLNGMVLFWNREAERLYGWNEKEMVGNSLQRIFPDDGGEELNAIMSAIRRGERVEKTEATRITKDGKVVHVSLLVSPIYNRQGDLIGASTIVHQLEKHG